MKIYQVWEHWETLADAYAFDQRPEYGKALRKSFRDKEKAEDYKKELEEKELESKGWNHSYYCVREDEVV